MPWTSEQIEAAAMQLPLAERALLAERLLASLDDVEVEREWAEEIDRRMEAYEEGKLRMYPGDEVLTEACGLLRS